ncbi:MAG: chorismate-binding protein [Nonlabens sp.]|nr:chorismate-binding protein [Nonlabens sp.]
MRENVLSYLQHLLDKNLPFLALRLSGENTVTILAQNDKTLHKTPHDNLSYGVFSKFQNNDSQYFIYGDVEQNFDWNINPIVLQSQESPLSDSVEKDYLRLLDKAIQTLQTGALKKVVLSRKQSFQTALSPTDLYANILDAYAAANCYFFYHPHVGSWQGATPETLVAMDSDELTTMSLAGTALWQKGMEHVWGAKELEEQQFVTEHIVEALKTAGVEGLVVSPVESVRAGTLLHLRTLISARTPFENHTTIAQALHPTPAICGIPTQQALEFISAHENYDRSFYTGYLGIVKSLEKRAFYFVNLRCMELKEKEATVYVGGGITAKSNAQAELNETINKSRTMSSLLN